MDRMGIAALAAGGAVLVALAAAARKRKKAGKPLLARPTFTLPGLSIDIPGIPTRKRPTEGVSTREPTAPEVPVAPTVEPPDAPSILDTIVDLVTPASKWAKPLEEGDKTTLGRTFRPKHPELVEPIKDAARAYNIPVNGFLFQMFMESNIDPDAGSPAGAVGVGQRMPSSGLSYGLISAPSDVKAEYKRIYNDKETHGSDAPKIANAWLLSQDTVRDNRKAAIPNIQAAAKKMRNLYESRDIGSWVLAAGAYNRGLGGLRKWLSGSWGLPCETANYMAACWPYYQEDPPEQMYGAQCYVYDRDGNKVYKSVDEALAKYALPDESRA